MKTLLKIILSLLIFAVLLSAAVCPFVRIDSFFEDKLRQAAFKAAEKGDEEGIREALRKVSIPLHRADINASLAYLYHKKGDCESLKTLMESKDFSMDSYLYRSLAYDIMREPDFMANLLEYKYLDKIASMKSDTLRTFPLYALGVKMGKKGEKYIDEAFHILNGRPDDQYRGWAVYRICKLALAHSRGEDIVRFIPLSAPFFELDMLIFEMLKNKDVHRVWFRNIRKLSRHDYTRQVAVGAISALKKNDENALKKSLFYYPARYRLNWKFKNFDDFNYPLYAYFAREIGDNELYRKYLSISKSREIARRNLGNYRQYKAFSEKMYKYLEETDAD